MKFPVATTLAAILGLVATCAFAANEGNDLEHCRYRSNGLPIPLRVCEKWRAEDVAAAQWEAASRAKAEEQAELDQARAADLARQQAEEEAVAAERQRVRQAEKEAKEKARVLAATQAAAVPLSDTEIATLLRQAGECVSYSNRVIAYQNAIGAEVGLVDQRALYNAGVNKVECRETTVRLTACKKAGSCPRDGYFTATPVTRSLPPDDM